MSSSTRASIRGANTRVGIDGKHPFVARRHLRGATNPANKCKQHPKTNTLSFPGRVYTRQKQSVYIDVMHLPIQEAVDEASRMLRAGLMHAMSASIPSVAKAKAAAASANAEKAKKAAEAKAAAEPRNVYAAIAAKSKERIAAALRDPRAAAESTSNAKSQRSMGASSSAGATAAAGSSGLESVKVKQPRLRSAPPAVAAKSKGSTAAPARDLHALEKPSGVAKSQRSRASSSSRSRTASPGSPELKIVGVKTARNWNAGMSAGPSILAKKRARAETAPPPRAAPMGVPRDAPLPELSGGPGGPSVLELLGDKRRRKAAAPSAIANLRKGKTARVETDAAHRLGDKVPAFGHGMANVFSKAAAAERQRTGRVEIVEASGIIRSQTDNERALANRPRALSDSGLASALASGRIPTSTGAVLSMAAVARRTGAGASSAPSLAAVASRSRASAPAGGPSTGRRPKPLSALGERFAAAGRRQAELPAVPIPGSIAAVSRARREGPSVQYLANVSAIGSVQPNGYIDKGDGTLKPIVTLDPRPKVPMKLRQTTIDKLFEAWKSCAKYSMYDALVKALRTEQTMYAQSASRENYRSAALTTLKQAKSE